MRNTATLIILVLIAFFAEAQQFRLVPEEGTPAVFSARVVDEEGRTVYRIQRGQDRDAGPPTVHLFESGTLLLIDGYAGVLELYGMGGRLERTLLFRDAVIPEHERLVVFAGIGDRIAMAIAEPAQRDVLVLMIDETGSTLIRTLLEGREHASGIALSPDGRLLAAGSYRWDNTTPVHSVDVLGSDGALMSSAAVEMRDGMFSGDGSLLLAAGSRTASMVNAITGEILSVRDFPVGSVIHDAVWDGSTAAIAVSPAPRFEDQRWVYPSLTVHTLATNGVSQETRSIAQPFTTVRLILEVSKVEVELDGFRQGDD